MTRRVVAFLSLLLSGCGGFSCKEYDTTTGSGESVVLAAAMSQIDLLPSCESLAEIFQPRAGSHGAEAEYREEGRDRKVARYLSIQEETEYVW